ncbi:MAG TPA: antibiotic biosynthesis monooxygenase [Thermomicrobiales bacterium]|nr:antibiotic biosynthesis monooxygenase [Thermomicrobiales bacterium]
MRYLCMAIHYPRPEYRDDLLRLMRRVNAVLRDQPGLLQLGDFDDAAQGRIIAVSVWESAAHFRAGWPQAATALAEARYDLWETRPLEFIASDEIAETAAPDERRGSPPA